MVITPMITLKKNGPIAMLSLDAAGQNVNVITQSSLEEIEALLKQIERDKDIKAVVISSAKDTNFIAGADIHELSSIKTKKAGEEAVKRAQKIFNTIENSKKPFVAAIHGACLGGGLEFALACHARVASLDAKTVFGLPEVNLGILPAAGGTQRLPRLVGLNAALPMLLSGKKISAYEAKKIGLVDVVVNQREELVTSATKVAEQIISRTRALKKPKWLYPWQLVVILVAKQKIRKLTYGHYPAPLSILQSIETGIIRGFQAGLKEEVRQFGMLLQTTVSKNLVRLFFAQKARQKNPFGHSEKTISKIGVVGSGLMGSGIAFVSLVKNLNVHLVDIRPEALSGAQRFIWNELQRQVKRRKISEFDRNRFMSRLSVGTDLGALVDCDIVIEAIVEDLSAKRELLNQLEQQKFPHIFATNTSSIPITEIAEKSARPDRIVGMHYFSPVPKMPLLEIITSSHTSRETLQLVCELGVQQGKTIIVVNDSAGFYTTRIIAALFDEACLLLEEGYSASTIDDELRHQGFPLGPVALMDEVGLDIALHVSETLLAHFGTRLVAANLDLSKKMIQQGFLGRKSGKGFYIYNGHRKSVNRGFTDLLQKSRSHKFSENSIGLRMLLRMVNEATFCRAENIIASADDGDVGAVFGVGFPPHLGGPFQFIEAMGQKKFDTLLETYRIRYGERFTRPPSWKAT